MNAPFCESTSVTPTTVCLLSVLIMIPLFSGDDEFSFLIEFWSKMI